MGSIGFFGGDLRSIKLAELFRKDGYIIYTYGLEKAEFNEKSIKKTTLEDFINETTYIFSSIPFSKDNENIYSPFSKEKMNIKEILPKLKNKKIITGAISEKFVEKAKVYNIEIIDILRNESLRILNAIPTAEGAIQIAMEASERTINGSKILILGFGRIGKILAKMLYRNRGKSIM
ncbi:MAG: hypothetical protein IJN50_03470 [Clostridia bacterium]|nr:hypothetical protein [Clostridia bacterium]